MRNLKVSELEFVGGAGFYSKYGSALGGQIGSVVDRATGGVAGSAADAGKTLGSGIGTIVDSSKKLKGTGIAKGVKETKRGAGAIAGLLLGGIVA